MIYTFYSYKGGVGRSMALANIAECFREKNLRVLIVDWDLEAPGIEAYFYPGNVRSDERLAESRKRPGLIDMLYEYKQAFPRFAEQRSAGLPFATETGATTNAPVESGSPADVAKATEALTAQLNSLEIPEFLRKSALQTLAPTTELASTPLPEQGFESFLNRLYQATSIRDANVPRELRGSPLVRFLQRVHPTEGLYLLNAGARGSDDFRSYATKVQDFDWAEFYATFEGRRYFEWLRSRMNDIADVVLIDSRTGLTEMGGVCTRQMPDVVVSFCTPNWQNVDGVVRIVAGLNDESVRVAREQRTVDVMVIPTRIDDAESTLLNDFRDRFVETAEKEAVPAPFQKLENPFWNLQIPYIPRYNYREQRVIGPGGAMADPPTERLIAAYRRLAVHLAVLAGQNKADLKVREAFGGEIATIFSHLGPSRAPKLAPRPPEIYVNRGGAEPRLRSFLIDGAATVSVWGAAGSGKTALVSYIVTLSEIEALFPDGIVWLSRDRAWTREAVLAFFQSGFGLPPSYKENAIAEFLADRRFLVVLDDIREQTAIDRVASLGKKATCILLTRDLALARRFTSRLITLGNLTDDESKALTRVDPQHLPIAPERAMIVDQLVNAFAYWPAGAAAIRDAYEFNFAQAGSSNAAWRQITDQISSLGVSALDSLQQLQRSKSLTTMIRDAIGQLEPAERRALAAAATQEDTPHFDADPAIIQRLSDYGLIDSDRCVAPIVRLWLIYCGDLPDPIASKKTLIEPSGPRAKAENDRTRAKEILRGASAPLEEIRALAERLKNVRSFSLARGLLARAPQSPEFGKSAQSLRLKLTQQHSLCTYRDTELPGSERYDRALSILEKGDLSNPQPSQETLGLAGAIYKNRWRQAGQRKDLERSLAYYERGASGELRGDYGYTRINAAIVLDLLAHQEANDSPGVSAERRAKARHIRQEVVEKLSGLAATPEHTFLRDAWWYYATMAESCFGLRQFEAARFWLKSGLALQVVDWEIESTTRQLAELAWAQGLPLADGSEEWQTLRVLTGDSVAALRGITTGKVGLALSGGGFRASLFHVGVLAKLAEADLLRHVEVLSCVSGGSIIGAHFYLELRHLLQTKADHEITRQDYVDIVMRIQRDFLDGVQMNLRTMVFRSWFANFLTLFKPGYTRTKRLAAMYEEHLFSRVKDGHTGPRYLRQLRITPKDGGADFNPKLDNWRRAAKVPILLLNATTLNTGHTWQFAVTWMGEPPPAQSSVDSNDVFRRMYYDDEAPAKYRDVRLGLAVAASACVPALLDPVELPDLYPGRTVRLVDGGVHDNQGIGGLLEQECRVILVSDASGDMNSEREPGMGLTSVPVRSNSILMARVREAQYRELEWLRRSSALTGMMFLHLKKELNINHVDWLGCQLPYQMLEERQTNDRNLVLTSYSVPRTVQELLAGIRTDLDTFSDIEAYSLMLSGYRMADTNVPSSIPILLDSGSTAKEQWDFQRVERSFSPYPDFEGENRRVLRVLSAARKRAFKLWDLSPLAFAAITLVLAAAFAMIVWLAAQIPEARHVGAWAGPVFVSVVFLLWGLHRLTESRKSLGILFTGALTVTVGWIVAAFHLAIFDPLYRAAGRVGVASRKSSAMPDLVSVLIVVIVLTGSALFGWRMVTKLRQPSIIAVTTHPPNSRTPTGQTGVAQPGPTVPGPRQRAIVNPEANKDLERGPAQGASDATSKNSSQQRAGMRGITVQYFAKHSDLSANSQLVKSWKELGFSVKQMPAKFENPSNTIWYGSSVDIPSIQAIGYSLLANGFALRLILPLSDPRFDLDRGNERVIQVGWSVYAEDHLLLTPIDIQNLAFR